MARSQREMVTQVTASAKFIRLSPYKVREVAALIRGKHVDEARRILAFTPKAASNELSKILESAIANAEHNFAIPQEELSVKIATADEGMTIKRFRPRAQGRGYRIRKRTSHINLVLERVEPKVGPSVAPRRRRKAADAPTETVATSTPEASEKAKPKRRAKKEAPVKAKTMTGTDAKSVTKAKTAKAEAPGPEAVSAE
ncbi:MAG: 50S ribosomal protein L22, partial [Actinobacteria bacterium]|nr:50S ribosomal protein L22 [Actinomycetota bacterium]